MSAEEAIEGNLKLALDALAHEHDLQLASKYIHVAMKYVRELKEAVV